MEILSLKVFRGGICSTWPNVAQAARIWERDNLPTCCAHEEDDIGQGGGIGALFSPVKASYRNIIAEFSGLTALLQHSELCAGPCNSSTS
jgi:hypothetical protein